MKLRCPTFNALAGFGREQPHLLNTQVEDISIRQHGLMNNLSSTQICSKKYLNIYLMLYELFVHYVMSI